MTDLRSEKELIFKLTSARDKGTRMAATEVPRRNKQNIWQMCRPALRCLLTAGRQTSQICGSVRSGIWAQGANCSEGCQSAALQRHTGTFQTFLHVHWGAAALYGQSLSAVDTRTLSFFSHESALVARRNDDWRFLFSFSHHIFSSCSLLLRKLAALPKLEMLLINITEPHPLCLCVSWRPHCVLDKHQWNVQQHNEERGRS